ncbi:MAG: regulatory protein MarR [Bacteroidetes bacterium 38_7]|nr:MAG: regulatory protein MarR [Bacteroidetes bacterium 38_7]HAL65076.1 MarR family transcriptional regulator [Bacteroidales bacterium]
MKIDDELKGHFRNEYHRGLINLIYTANYVSYEFLRTLRHYNLTEQQYNVLRVLRGFRHQAPLTIGFLKERMLDRDSNISRIVERLYAKGLVSRTENPKDRREKSIQITDNGLKLLDAMFECEKNVDQLLKNLSLEEVNELNRLLDKIREKDS